MVDTFGSSRRLIFMLLLGMASFFTLISNMNHISALTGFSISFSTPLTNDLHPLPPSLLHLDLSISPEKKPVRDWFQVATENDHDHDPHHGAIQLRSQSLRMVGIEKSGVQCLRACFESCNRSLPSVLSESLNLVYYDQKGMKKSQQRFNVACAKLVVTAPKIVFERVHDGEKKRQISLYGAPYFPKNEWTMNLQRYANKNNCEPDLFESFDLSLKPQCEQLLAKRKFSGMFFWKDPHSFGGKSIEIKTVRAKFPDPAARCPMRGLFAQRYANPLWLLNGKKFDNRVYLFILSFHPLVVYMRPGHIHASLFDFNISSTFKPVHVTNGHIQEPYCTGCANEDWKKFIKPNALLLQDLVSKHGHVQGQEMFRRMVQGQIRSVAQLVLSSRNLFRISQDKLDRNQHGMLGLDMLVTEDMRWYILDVNRYPGWRPGPRHIVRDNYFANVEAYTMLADYVITRKLNRAGKNEPLLQGKPRYWLQVYNENQDNPSPHLTRGECAKLPNDQREEKHTQSDTER